MLFFRPVISNRTVCIVTNWLIEAAADNSTLVHFDLNLSNKQTSFLSNSDQNHSKNSKKKWLKKKCLAGIHI